MDLRGTHNQLSHGHAVNVNMKSRQIECDKEKQFCIIQ